MQTNFTTRILFTAAQQSEYILCTYSVAYPITPPPISIWVELTRKQKLSSLKYIPYIHIASSNQKETTISATQHKMMYCTSRMPSYRPIPIALLQPMISAYLNTGKSGIWHSSLDLFFLTECEVALLLESPESRDTLPGVRSERHCIVCR